MTQTSPTITAQGYTVDLEVTNPVLTIKRRTLMGVIMNITTYNMYNYAGTDNSGLFIINDGERHSVPLDELNRHYIEIILEWKDGNTIADAE